MSGVKGAGGPIPKRSDQRRRRNAPARPVKKAAASTKKSRPAANSHWHPVARRWYSSLADSGQSVFYEPSDWALAYLIAESISRELKPHPLIDGSGKPLVDKAGAPIMVERPPKGAAMSSWLKAMTSLLVSEGDRRRLQIELSAAATDGDASGGASVSSIDAWRSRTDGTG